MTLGHIQQPQVFKNLSAVVKKGWNLLPTNIRTSFCYPCIWDFSPAFRHCAMESLYLPFILYVERDSFVQASSIKWKLMAPYFYSFCKLSSSARSKTALIIKNTETSRSWTWARWLLSLRAPLENCYSCLSTQWAILLFSSNSVDTEERSVKWWFATNEVAELDLSLAPACWGL